MPARSGIRPGSERTDERGPAGRVATAGAIHRAGERSPLQALKLNDRLGRWARQVKRDGITLWFAGKHPATPWPAKTLGVLVVAYALSPIDLIPDFIPVLGYLDDIVLLPILIWLTVRMLPPQVLADCRDQADAWLMTQGSRPTSRWGAALVVLIWIALGGLLWISVVRPWL